ncbi:hypothetical protein K7640_02550 [Micromonospora sp. PLK6-60]|uniref:hypothetical protein n=1 Tax=Micromonospora sp. PLK6-60 TaxID=2873383 RepID=UPI001CA695D7|nr:hypothetical protein [Micromonospora sp. PLK6-60]MBY8870721.1 hypothetical protein [Micromonospora sp. PLK6-60]
MDNALAVRLLWLVVVVLAASLAGTIASWISWATEPSIGKALASGAGTFAGMVSLVLAAANFLTRRDV